MKLRHEITALWAIYLRGLIILRARLDRNLISFFLSPGLYALAFGWGVGRELEMEGVPYLAFLLPGLIAVSGMNQSVGIASEINYARFLNRFFEEFLLSPAGNWVVVLGNVLYGMTRGAGSFLAVLVIGAVFGVMPRNAVALIPLVLLNSFMFACLGVWIALSVKSHRDLNSFMSFVIVPISFVAGTFFSLDTLPLVFSVAAKVIPLTHSSLSIRSVYLGHGLPYLSCAVMAGFAAVFFFLAVLRVRRAVV
jgi:ABC-2 type transport system permease protein